MVREEAVEGWKSGRGFFGGANDERGTRFLTTSQSDWVARSSRWRHTDCHAAQGGLGKRGGSKENEAKDIYHHAWAWACGQSWVVIDLIIACRLIIMIVDKLPAMHCCASLKYI